jgi:arsenate reductase
MAEGIIKALYSDRYDAYSAGTTPTDVNPHAVKVMAEIGIDISTHIAKSVEEFRGKEFDYVITVCDRAKESCPFFPGAKKYIHKAFDDPVDFTGTEDEILASFRNLRDKVKEWIEETFIVRDV